MIRNVYGKAVTESTVRRYRGLYSTDMVITRNDMASAAIALKNTQGKEEEAEKEAFKYAQRLRAQYERQLGGFTQGWIYNATGSAITLVDCRDWGGGLVSNPYPLKIDNGQWGMFIHKHIYLDPAGSCGGVLYQGLNNDGIICYWCIAWNNNNSPSGHIQTNVHVKIVRNVNWEENCWESVRSAIQESSILHKTNQEGLYSIITASNGPSASFEALLTLQ